MSVPTLSVLLSNGSNDTMNTVPRATDIAQWSMIATLVGCVMNPETLTAALDAASQLITVVIVLLLVRSGVRYTPARDSSSNPLVSDTNA
ncbi:hypothetical protein GCM10017557_42130 [Streptomyces aurantiacus]|uniref:Uncharacterized protein n=1 Tax=Streptomyces aurantiacus TaxID=47760 RepID=A0A7G1P665_9ACTN|nr:hypothetical protein GCM10017557_42130 [Streptomyces aurantiacus]